MYRLLAIAIAVGALFQATHQALAQDSLRIIELSGPGESAPVNVPAGHAFTFSLFAPEAGKSDAEAAVGLVTYDSFTYESKYRGGYLGDEASAFGYQGWYLGPAKVVLRGSVAAVRMQLYTLKLPSDVAHGLLKTGSPSHIAKIPIGSLLTPLLGFQTPIPFGRRSLREFTNYLAIQGPGGVIYGVSRFEVGGAYYWQAGTPRIRGSASLHNPNAPASAVVRGFYFDDLDAVSPTADFVGPGTATFSLPPEGERSTPIAFYCYRITPANVIGADASPPVVKVTAPKTASASTGASSYVLKGSVTDNINATSIRFRVRAPNTSAYGQWDSVSLGGDAKTKSWQHTISLPRKGEWLVQVQAFDDEKNGSTVQTLTLTRQ